MKATFQVTMISDAETVNVSNMPIQSEEEYKSAPRVASSEKTPDQLSAYIEQGLNLNETVLSTKKWKKTVFEASPIMSSYLVAFANGPFLYRKSSYISPLTNKVVPLGIYATYDYHKLSEKALEVKAQVMPIYEQVFKVPYMAPKCDTLIAHAFDAGAMENVGL